MEVDPKSLHPSIVESINEMKQMRGIAETADKAALTARMNYGNLQFKRHAVPLLALMAGLFAVVVAAVAETVSLGYSDAIQMLTCLVTSAVAVWLFVLACRRAGRDLTMRHVHAAAAALKLDRGQRGYLDAVLAIDGSPNFSQADGDEILSGLNGLLDQDRHLAQISEGLGAVSAEGIREERDSMKRLAESASDEDAKRAYDHSIELLEARLVAAEAREVARQRVDGQRALVTQAILSIRDSLANTKGPVAAVPTMNLESLRRTIDTVHSQAVAVESAIEEVRALTA